MKKTWFIQKRVRLDTLVGNIFNPQTLPKKFAILSVFIHQSGCWLVWACLQTSLFALYYDGCILFTFKIRVDDNG